VELSEDSKLSIKKNKGYKRVVKSTNPIFTQKLE